MEIPGYTIFDEIGHGGMATVYRAHQHNFDSEVAIKIMDLSLLRDKQFGERFVREARIMRRLRHNNIVLVHDVGRYQDYYYIAMEYLNGGSLKNEIAKGKIDLHSACSIVCHIAQALDYAHLQSCIHRDIKPANILFRSPNEPVLADFGIARADDFADTITQTGAVMGTPHYMSPEQVKGKPLSSRSDLYSLGVVFFELLTGHVPYPGTSLVDVATKHLSDPIPTLPQGLEQFQSIIDTAMAKEPANRFERGLDFGNAIIAAWEDGVHAGSKASETIAAGPLDPDGTELLVNRQLSSVPSPPSFPSRVAEKSSADRGIAKQRKIRKTLLWLAVVVLLPTGVYFSSEYLSGPDEVTVTHSSAISKKIDQLLADAQQAFKEQRYADSEAYFRTVLAYDVGNQTARLGLKHIGNSYAAAAQKAADEEDIDIAQQNILGLLRVNPDHEELVDLQTRLQWIVFSREKAAEEKRAQQQHVKDLLTQAQQAVDSGRLVLPQGDSAYDLYQQVLAIDVENSLAQEGVNGIAASFIAAGRAALASGNLVEANSQIQAASQIAPNHADLFVVQRELKTKEDEQAKKRFETARLELERERKIASLMKAAAEDEMDGRLILPKGNNAFDKYQEIIVQERGHRQAQEKQQALIIQLFGDLEKIVNTGQLNAAEELLAALISVVPQHDSIPEWQSKIRKEKLRLTNERENQQQISRLLEMATTAKENNELDKAYNNFQNVLKIDAGNSTAQAGIAAIIKTYIKQAESMVDQGQLIGAERLIAKIISIAPNHSDLEEVQESLFAAQKAIALREEERKRRAQAQKRNEVAQLLDKAKTAMGNAQYISPKNTSAVALYETVLELDKKNRDANEGLQNIFQIYFKKAKKLTNTSQIASLKNNIAILESISPQDNRLSSLKKQLSEIEEAQQLAIAREEQFGERIKSIEGLLGNKNYTLQDIEGAVQQANSARELLPGDDRLVAIQDKITLAYYQLAQQQVEDESYDEALLSVDSGLKYQASNADLLELKSEITETLHNKKQKLKKRTFSSF